MERMLLSSAGKMEAEKGRSRVEKGKAYLDEFAIPHLFEVSTESFPTLFTMMKSRMHAHFLSLRHLRAVIDGTRAVTCVGRVF